MYIAGPNVETYWEITEDEDRSVIVGKSNEVSPSRSVHSEKGCLAVNCYRFSISDFQSYVFMVDNVTVASSAGSTRSTEKSLFGTCHPDITTH